MLAASGAQLLPSTPTTLAPAAGTHTGFMVYDRLWLPFHPGQLFLLTFSRPSQVSNASRAVLALLGEAAAVLDLPSARLTCRQRN
jgi:hypothetical protein